MTPLPSKRGTHRVDKRSASTACDRHPGRWMRRLDPRRQNRHIAVRALSTLQRYQRPIYVNKPLSLHALGGMPELDERMETLFCWLASRDLVEGGTMDVGAAGLDGLGPVGDGSVALAQATGRQRLAQRQRRDEMKAIKDRFKDQSPAGVTSEAIWGAVKNPAASIRTLNWQKLPADAMAFYRPFHYPPFDQWGIYLLVSPLLGYHARLQRIACDLKLFSSEVLMHLVLFEIFNHEFFHHLAESSATALEILAAARGDVQPVYLDYRRAQHSTGFDFPHAPLEEALANAYAHNALSFISRIKAGYKTASIKSYQEAIKAALAPGAQRLQGCRSLYRWGLCRRRGSPVGQLLGKPDAVHFAPLSCLAKHLMPNGFTALVQKPDIPTYLVGSEEELKVFESLVPAPNEAYTQLFWPYNTKAIDDYVAKKQAEEKEMRRAMKARAGNAQQGSLDLSSS